MTRTFPDPQITTFHHNGLFPLGLYQEQGFLNRWYHSYQNHSGYQIVTKKEEQNYFVVKS